MRFRFNSDKADMVERFFRTALCHVKGEMAGKPFTLDPWQIKPIREIFGWEREDGTRKYRTVYIEIPRKNGKSTLASGIALALLYLDREPGGEVFSAAADLDQANIIFNAASSMVKSNAALNSITRCYRKSIYVPGTGSSYRALSADAPNKHGLNASGIIFDELHAQKDRDLYDVLVTSTGARRQPLTVLITTAGYDRSSICWEMHDYAKKVSAGVIEDHAFYPLIYAAADDDDWTDPEVWRKANPGLGVSLSEEYLAAECERAKRLPAYQNTFRRLHLNQWTQQDTRWLDMTEWDACAGEPVDEASLRGRPCYAGIDLSSTTDLTAFVLVFPASEEGGKLSVLCRFFVPGDTVRKRSRQDLVGYDAWIRDGHAIATQGNVVDYSKIRAEVNRLGKLYNIREIAFDRWNATGLQTDLAADGFTVFPFGQGFASMSAPSKELEKLVLSRGIHHGGHPVLRWNAGNVAVLTDAAGNIKPAKDVSTGRIDGIVALCMAIGRASVHGNAKRSVYSKRGLRSL